MPRVALPDSLQLCKISGCLYTPYIQDQHYFTIFIVDFEDYRRPLHSTYLPRPCRVSSDTGYCWFEASLRSARLQGLLEVGPARLLTTMVGGLGVFTLCLIKTVTQFSSLFGASNQPCCLLQCSGTTLRVRLRYPLVFLVVSTCWETCFSSRRYLTYFFFSSSFLDHHTGHPACHDARILLMSASSMPSEFFHRRLDLLEACFP
jgi:hypothetical protein